MQSLMILGRQPALGLAELENLYGAEPVRVIGKSGVVLDISPEAIDFKRLGGSIKLSRILHTVSSTKWRDIENYLSDSVLEHISSAPEGKLKLGLSAYGLRVSPGDINVTGLRLKKIIKSSGRSVRIVPNKTPELNSAQVLHNQLTGPSGIELVVARHNDKTIIARNVAEQDIEAYAKRDQGRPMRDAKVGMLPPKLAQIIINLASNKPQPQGNGVDLSTYGVTLLDPFCGTGVILQEALLMGYDAYGTDLEPRMIRYSKQNLEWLTSQTELEESVYELEVGDATTHAWQNIIKLVACETYLGKPLTSLPPRQVLDKIIAECDEIHENFLENIGLQIRSGTRLCLAVPAWRTKQGFLHLKTLAKLDELGYTQLQFVHARNQELIYHRPGQTVARELVVLVKK